MQDNSTNDAMELLISYMDGELDATEKAATEKMLQDDAALKERFENLVAAKQVIKAHGLKQHIQSLHQQYYTETQAAETAPVKVIKPAFGLKTFMRIAAVFILVVAGYGVYQYAATSNESLYADNFISYQLPVTRGAEQTDDLDALYNANNYSAVIAAVNGKQQKTQKDYFLAAQAYLQTNDATAAIAAFKNVEQLNSTATDKYFAQETDYYLALAYIKAGNNGVGDCFGSSVSLKGDTLAVGASGEDSNATTITNGAGVSGTDGSPYTDNGAVYVYKRTGNNWAQEAYIKAVNNGAGDHFGISVSLSGDTLAVGARIEGSNATTITNGSGFSGTDTGADASGAVYVYKRTGNNWAQEAYIKAVNNGSSDSFGFNVSISGDSLVVTTYFEDSNATTVTNGTSFSGVDIGANDSGAAYIYKRTGNNWAQEAYIKAVNNGAGDNFGISTSLSGDTLAVGAYAEDSDATTITSGASFSGGDTASNSGAVYVYKRTGIIWAQEAYIKAVNSRANAYFGKSVSLSGNTLAVGAYQERFDATTITDGTGFTGSQTKTWAGAVYVYKRTGSNWEQEAYIKAINNESYDYFGSSVSISGDTLAVGATGEDSEATTITNGAGFSGGNVFTDSGAVYVYRNNARLFNTQDVFRTNVSTTSLTLNWISSGFKTTGYFIAYAQGLNAPVDCS